MRVGIDEAVAKGWITKQEGELQKIAQRQRRPQNLSSARMPIRLPAEKETAPRTVSAEIIKPVKPVKMICSIDGDMPQEKLWRACIHRWKGWVSAGKLVWELEGAVPGRRFRLDIAFPDQKLAVEVDGWEHHGKYLSDFKRDRLRDRLLVVEGWRVLRFFAEEIHSDSDALTEEIAKALHL